ncbi:cysteine desulfurase family protein [Mariniluteicoccus endophyticus]
MRCYLDHAASSPMVPEAVEAMAAELGLPGNASSLHASGRRARAVVEDARESLAADLGCDPVEVVMTSGGTEADNLALQGAWLARPRGVIGQRDRVVTSAVEHPAVAETVVALGRRGADAHVVGVDADGVLDLDALDEALRTPTMIVSVMGVNNETGTAQDIATIVDRARAAGAWAHSDAVQALGHVPLSFRDLALDLMGVSAHKVGGPVGIGALVVRRGLPLRAFAYGGGQERDLRSGTVAPALAAGFAAAVRRAVRDREAEAGRLGALRARIVEAAGRVDGTRVNGAPGSPGIVNIGIDRTRADDVLMLLDAAGIDCSTGSACTAGVHQPSEVLLAMGRTEAEASQAIRLSLGWSTTDADIDRLVAALPDAVARARTAYGA